MSWASMAKSPTSTSGSPEMALNDMDALSRQYTWLFLATRTASASSAESAMAVLRTVPMPPQDVHVFPPSSEK